MTLTIKQFADLVRNGSNRELDNWIEENSASEIRRYILAFVDSKSLHEPTQDTRKKTTMPYQYQLEHCDGYRPTSNFRWFDWENGSPPELQQLYISDYLDHENQWRTVQTVNYGD